MSTTESRPVYEAFVVQAIGGERSDTVRLGRGAETILGSEQSIRLNEEDVDELIVHLADEHDFCGLEALSKAAQLLDGHNILVIERVWEQLLPL